MSKEMVGTVVNGKHHMLCLKRAAPAVLLPCLNAGPIWGELPILQEKLKSQVLCNMSHFKILPTNCIEIKITWCQSNRMLLWTDFSKGHQCAGVRPGLPTPTMLFSPGPSTEKVSWWFPRGWHCLH